MLEWISLLCQDLHLNHYMRKQKDKKKREVTKASDQDYQSEDDEDGSQEVIVTADIRSQEVASVSDLWERWWCWWQTCLCRRETAHTCFDMTTGNWGRVRSLDVSRGWEWRETKVCNSNRTGNVGITWYHVHNLVMGEIFSKLGKTFYACIIRQTLTQYFYFASSCCQASRSQVLSWY